MYIHQIDEWPAFTRDAELLSAPLAEVRHQQGLLLGKLTMMYWSVARNHPT